MLMVSKFVIKWFKWIKLESEESTFSFQGQVLYFGRLHSK